MGLRPLATGEPSRSRLVVWEFMRAREGAARELQVAASHRMWREHAGQSCTSPGQER